MTEFATTLANPVMLSISILIFIFSLYKIVTIKPENTNIPGTVQDLRMFQLKKNFLYFALIISGLLPIVNYILVLLGH
jgi:hypothetical protein